MMCKTYVLEWRVCVRGDLGSGLVLLGDAGGQNAELRGAEGFYLVATKDSVNFRGQIGFISEASSDRLARH